MESDHLVLVEDELADELIRRGRTAGSGWVVASGFATAMAIALWSTKIALFGIGLAAALLAVGLRRRRRYWADAARQVGDGAMQRARWRSVGIDVTDVRR